jgi:hypothetical protein
MASELRAQRRTARILRRAARRKFRFQHRVGKAGGQMTSRDLEIRDAQRRVISLFDRRPEAAFSTKRLSGQLTEGLACRVAAEGADVTMDMPKGLGGEGNAPSPGHFIRAGLIGCVAIGIKLTAIREAIEIVSINVDVEMDFDDGALLAMGTNTAAPLETRLIVAIKSSAPSSDVVAMVDRALAADPYYLAFRDPQNIRAEVTATGI